MKIRDYSGTFFLNLTDASQNQSSHDESQAILFLVLGQAFGIVLFKREGGAFILKK